MIESRVSASRTGIIVLAHGIDLVEIARVERLMRDHAGRFLERVFTSTEQEVARTRGRRQSEFLAGRFASKEAVLKALGTGLSDGVGWTEIEVLPDPRGAPGIILSGRTLEIASSKGLEAWLVSISHTDTHAQASVLAGRRST